MHALFPPRPLLCAVTRAVPRSAAILIRTETDPGLVAGFTRALCTSQRKHPSDRMRSRTPGQFNAGIHVWFTFVISDMSVNLWDLSALNYWNPELCNLDVSHGRLCKARCWMKMNDLCNIIWWIIYEPNCSGNHQQVRDESTMVVNQSLKTAAGWWTDSTERPEWNDEVSLLICVSLCRSHTICTYSKSALTHTAMVAVCC